ncbi:HAD-IA family hydrolase [Prosthecomicrobium sp. N25]|uniref:HAD-IA family hydrolase n=1 Tax=Prosthecomicrobium sp. N25 TaxID=3129254 RepID=UPI003077B270
MDLILFDVDGTLVDSQHMIVGSMDRAFLALGREPPSREATLGVVGLSLQIAIGRLAPDTDDAGIADLAEAYSRAFQELRAGPHRQEPLFPGALAAIERLGARDGVVLGIATGKSRRGVASLLDLHALHGRFATIQTADDHPSKPHPSMILTALDETGIDPDRAIIVGDSSYDMEMARAAGIRPIGVAWGYMDPETLRRAGAEAILESYEDLDGVAGRLLDWS